MISVSKAQVMVPRKIAKKVPWKGSRIAYSLKTIQWHIENTLKFQKMEGFDARYVEVSY
jgi:hypothetical protein